MTERTAQDAYKLMLRTQIAPRLRNMRFKGSGNNFSIQRKDGWLITAGVPREPLEHTRKGCI